MKIETTVRITDAGRRVLEIMAISRIDKAYTVATDIKKLTGWSMYFVGGVLRSLEDKCLIRNIGGNQKRGMFGYKWSIDKSLVKIVE